MIDRAMTQIAIWLPIAMRPDQNTEWTNGMTEKPSNAKDAINAKVMKIDDAIATILLSRKAGGLAALMSRRQIAKTNIRSAATTIAARRVIVEAMILLSRFSD